MKRVKLIKSLNKLAKDTKTNFVFVREGGNHEVWSMNGVNIIIPRHSEVNELTAKGILKTAEKAAK